MKSVTKVSFLIAASVVVLLAVIYAASQLIVLKGFLVLENDTIARNASRVSDALNDDISTLGRETAIGQPGMTAMPSSRAAPRISSKKTCLTIPSHSYA